MENRRMIRRAAETSSLATLAGLACHYGLFFFAGVPLLTESIAEWIMARTPSAFAVSMLEMLGPWAKPFAVTGGLATLGFFLFIPAAIMLGARGWLGWVAAGAFLAGLAMAVPPAFAYEPALGVLSFFVPAGASLGWLNFQRGSPGSAALPSAVEPSRRILLRSAAAAGLPLIMTGGAAAVALESFLREQALARRAARPVPLFPFDPSGGIPPFGDGLVRKAVTPLREFYVMSKNTVDPAVDPGSWRLLISVDGEPAKRHSYNELLTLSRATRYATLRCVSNTLQSNLMGTALWSGVRLGQLIDHRRLPAGIVEAVIIGVDGHDDSLPVAEAFSEDVILALGMNGETLARQHGFPVRLLAPRYYGFKSIKWIREIAFVRKPYFGTWPRMGYTKEPVIHTMSFIDRVRREGDAILAGGVSFAGIKGIRRVQVRAGKSPWQDATIERPLSRYTWTRWVAAVPGAAAQAVEARAQDGMGGWQAAEEKPLFPDGVAGPTIRKLQS
jgi:DMSO/TMAO reductase YedYZ molybdopterin-dependent catalytic subunit